MFVASPSGAIRRIAEVISFFSSKDAPWSSRLRKKGKALSRSVWSLNCLGGIRHVIGQFE